MKFDYSGAECFLSYLQGKTAIAEVVAHPAYQTIFLHNKMFGDGLKVSDIERAVLGEQTAFYAMDNVKQNISKIRMFLDIIRCQEGVWLKQIEDSILRLFPQEDLHQITIYPIIGYNAGIGMNGCVCMNLNWWQKYAATPYEFLSTAIHETFHVIYERYHQLPDLNSLITSDQQLAYFYLMVQNEGLAVFAPLAWRQKMGYSGNCRHRIFKDYQVLENSSQIILLIEEFYRIVDVIKKQNLDLSTFLALVFSNSRITYRVGCALARRIEQTYGLAELQKAIKMTGTQMISQYEHLLK